MTLWMLGAVNGTVSLMMLRSGYPGVAALNLLGLATLSWAGYLSRQTDLQHAIQDLGAII